MRKYIDQMNREIFLSEAPKRIISLVPSQTELLYDLGLEEEVVGITKFCVHPNVWFRTKTRIGGTKALYIEKIVALKPDLIIANKEENNMSDILILEQVAPVWISDVRTIPKALEMIEKIGVLVDQEQASIGLILEIKAALETVSKPKQKLKVLYVIWNEPLMIAAGDTFIHDMMHHLGFENAARHLTRYPQLTEESFAALKPDLIFLSSEPFPFKQKHIQFFEKLCPNACCRLVDGELFSWYGSRMRKIDDLGI